MKELGIEIRAGIHTGEVETIDGKVGGMAVPSAHGSVQLPRPQKCLFRRR